MYAKVFDRLLDYPPLEDSLLLAESDHRLTLGFALYLGYSKGHNCKLCRRPAANSLQIQHDYRAILARDASNHSGANCRQSRMLEAIGHAVLAGRGARD
ncbi:hypothetical protein PSCICM_51170 [Pseudomonas cichorii]|nr:hypothetical protein PSCICM_51170 [Pseudomonas cichorii]